MTRRQHPHDRTQKTKKQCADPTAQGNTETHLHRVFWETGHRRETPGIDCVFAITIVVVIVVVVVVVVVAAAAIMCVWLW